MVALWMMPFCLHGEPRESAGAVEFRRLRDVYTNAVAAIEAKRSGRTKDLPAQYQRELDALGKACQQKGDLKGVLAVKEERERAKGATGESGTGSETEPGELKALRERFRVMPAELDRQKQLELDGLAASYVKHLGNLERRLTVQGDIDAAVAVHAETLRVQPQTATAAAQGPSESPAQQAGATPSEQRIATDRPAERQADGLSPAVTQKAVSGGTASAQGARTAPVTLTGTQKDQEVKLPPGGTYRVDGEYSVPAGMSLEIGPGASLLFKKGASLSVAGTLNVGGTADLPVRFSGQANGTGYWKGIVITGKEESRIEYAKIEGAQEGVFINQRKTCILNSLLTGNVTGIKVGTSGVYDVRPQLENCFITGNKTHGVFITFATVQLTDCTITRNGGFGVWGIYYPNANLLRSVVTKNAEGGIYGSQYTGVVTAHDSVVAENRGADVVHACDGDWDFSGCWWGDTDTKKLGKSDTANLTCITDSLDGKGKGRVILKGFLTAPPAKCGAKLAGVLGKDKAGQQP